MMSSDEGKALVIDRFGDRFHNAIARGVKALQDCVSPQLLSMLSATGRANVWNNAIWGEVRREFESEVETGTIELSNAFGFPMLNLEGRALIRIKKLNRGRPCNIMTRQQKAIYRQTKNMFGLEEAQATWLHIGYNLTALTLGTVELQCWIGRRLAWAVTIPAPLSLTSTSSTTAAAAKKDWEVGPTVKFKRQGTAVPGEDSADEQDDETEGEANEASA